MEKFHNFRINGLFSKYDVDIPINDNRLVLVGPNGIGKSSVSNILYYFLSRQWPRLSEYDFESIEIAINNYTVSISKEEALGLESLFSSFRRFNPRIRSFVDTLVESNRLSAFVSQPLSPPLRREYAALLNMPISEVASFRNFLKRRLDEEEDPTSVTRLEVEISLTEIITSKILFLPTYRRIERDLRTIFPDLEEKIGRYMQPDSPVGRKANHFVELVSFGMEDVENIINQTLSRLKEKARSELNSLSGNYLRDVIRGDADDFDSSIIKNLVEEDIDAILDRVEERALSAKDKKSLKEAILNIQARARGRLKTREKYLAHYFAKLVQATEKLQNEDREIRAFGTVCDRYLGPSKTSSYDDVKYSFDFQSNDDRSVPLSFLSSGEKQVVSLFSHIYMDESESFIIIIDEPELSLSVAWQKDFLPDILNSQKCSLLIAVTHSPFIFDNELREYTLDLRKCISPTNQQ